MKRRSLAFAALLAGIVAIPTVAYAADQDGGEGRIKNIELLSPSADNYVQYHGRVFINHDKRTTEYRWGGTSCGSKVLSDALVDRLVDAAKNKDLVKVKPRYAKGAGELKCLVGFTIRHAPKKSTP